MSKNRYYLVCRDKETDVVKAISFSCDDIIGNHDTVTSCENSLCDIDLFTSKFKSKGAFVLYLYHNGLIDNYDSDIYIISRNGDSINTMSCIYGGDQFGREIRTIAYKKRDKKFDNGSINAIFNDFARRMYRDQGFYTFVLCGYSNIYPKFVDYFKDCDSLSDMYNTKLREGAWAFGSYHLIRNIVETYSSYNKNKDNFSQAHAISREREVFGQEVILFTDKDYVEGQLSLFDTVVSDDREDYVFDSLDNLSVNAFSSDNNGIKFNRRFFSKYEDELYALELERLVASNILNVLLNYARISASDDDISSIRKRHDEIKAYLMRQFRGDSTLLDRVYSFVLLYNKCMRDNGMGTSDGYCKRIKDK